MGCAPVKVDDAIGAVKFTVLATDALFWVMHCDAVFQLVHGLSRATPHTRRIITMVAESRYIMIPNIGKGS